MRRGRSAADQEGLRRVLLLAGALLGVAGLGITAWGLVSDGWGLVVGPVLVLFAVACVVVSRDDGRGRWCPECVARNPEDATVCESCGASLG
jgi:hypothetical protein